MPKSMYSFPSISHFRDPWAPSDCDRERLRNVVVVPRGAGRKDLPVFREQGCRPGVFAYISLPNRLRHHFLLIGGLGIYACFGASQVYRKTGSMHHKSDQSTALNVPNWVCNRLFHLSKLGVECIPQPISEQVEGHHSDQDGNSRHRGDPPGIHQPISSVSHHRSPTRG